MTQQATQTATGNPMAIWSFVLGMVAIIVALALAALTLAAAQLPVVFGIIAGALGIVGYTRSNSTAGKHRTLAVLGGIGGVVAIIMAFSL